jgi:Domain of unknown function (DUF5919)
MKPTAPRQRGRAGPAEVVQLHGRTGYRPDLGGMARQQVASSRLRLELTTAEFADVLAPLLGWAPSAEMIESWETSVVPPGDVVLAAGLAAQAAPRELSDWADTGVLDQLVGRRFADVEAVYATRSEFTSRVPPHTLFDGASEIRAAGLSLNLINQQYASDSLASVIRAGGSVQCLFLDPSGEAIQDREREEGFQPGRLSSLTELNMQTLIDRVRDQLPTADRDRLAIATYDQVIRYNITLIDGTFGVVQPYLHAARGVEAPTIVLRRRGTTGLYPVFEKTFNWLWERSRPV